MSTSRAEELLNSEDLWHETVRVKLSGLLETSQFANFSKCGKEQLYRTCTSCHDWTPLSYRCSIKWCPRCNWMISRRRAALLRIWTQKITQPKHLVTTQRNFPILTRRALRQHIRNLAKLRKQKVFRDVKGGCISVEITNEGRGWHLHAHWYVDARWIDASAIAIAWGKLCGQEFGIVKVKDARQKDYAHEVAKYVVKGSELAKWEPDLIMQFVHAVKGVRFFITFGSLTKLRKDVEKELAFLKPETKPCQCGCRQFIYETDEASVRREIRNSKRR